MKVAIHQPHYLPWLGYCAKWAAADCFVLLDTVQYEKNGWQNRNRIKTREGVRWLTVPVRARLGMSIRDVPIADGVPWARRHLASIEHAYARAAHLDRFRGELREFYGRAWTHLAPAATESACWLARALGIRTPVRLASALVRTATDPTERLVELCRAAGGTTYLAGGDGATYMDVRRFADAGIRVLHQRYEPLEYVQLHGQFVPLLSALDILLTHGDDALGILRSGDHWDELA